MGSPGKDIAMAKGDGSALQKEGETLEKLFDGGLQIIQPSKGYRFSIDAILLASFFREQLDDRILEIGPGSGVISLLLAHRSPTVQITGIEIQEDLADIARRNAALNGMTDRIAIHSGDIRRIEKHLSAASFDAALFNPPYRRLHSGKVNPDRQKAIARHEVAGSFADFISGSRHLLKPGGRVAFIYPAPRTIEAITRMRHEKIEPKRMRIVHSYPDSEAQFILVEGIKEGGEELHILPPLFIYRQGKDYTEEMNRIFVELGRQEPAAGN
jgi:tRNA1Val (adenine37-N6)-methyltransferase